MDFLDQQIVTEDFIDTPGETSTVPRNLSEQIVDSYAAATKRPPRDIKQDVEAGNYPLLKQEASDIANAKAVGYARQRVNRLVSMQGDIESAQKEYDSIRESLVFGQHVAPDVAALIAPDAQFSGVERRILERTIAAQRIIEEKREQSTEGVLPAVGYWFDVALSEVFHSIGGAQAELTGLGDETFEGAGQLIELAKEANQLLYMDIAPEDFENRMRSILDRVANAGLFSEENPQYLEGFLALAAAGGMGTEAGAARVFQGLDVLTSGIPSITKGATRLGATGRFITKVGERDAAKELTVVKAEAGEDSALVTEGTSVAAYRPATEDVEYYAAPELQAARELEANNSALERVKKTFWNKLHDEALLAQKFDEYKQQHLAELTVDKRHQMNYDVVESTGGGLIGRAVLGKRGGTPYTTISAAEKMAAKIGGEVREQIVEGKTQYVVFKEWNISTKDLIDPTDLTQVTDNLFHQIMSTTARTTEKLDAMLKEGEAVNAAAVKDITKEYRKTFKAASKEERNRIENIFEDILNDPNENWRTAALNEKEFKDYYFNKYKEPAPQSTVDHYKSLRDISDVDYYTNAGAVLQDAVNNNERMVKVGGIFVRAKRVTPDSGFSVYDTYLNRLRKVDEVDLDKAVVYELANVNDIPGVGLVRYIMGDELVTRRLFHTDVMEYNFGGHRKYTNPYRAFVKQEGRDVNLAGGDTWKGRPKTLMATRSEREANIAVEQMNNIVDAIKRGVSGRQLDDVISKNNDWNLDIETRADLDAFENEYGVDFSQPFGRAMDGEPLEARWAGQDTYGNAFRNAGNLGKARGKQVLLGFGGEPLETLNPTKAIERGFVMGMARRSEMNYLHNAIEGWVKAAEKSNGITDWGSPTSNSRLKMENAKTSSSAVGKKLERERKLIQFRLRNSTSLTRTQTRLLTSIADWAFEGDKKRLGKLFDRIDQMDPAGQIRALAFHTKLGLFAIDQLYVQGSQLINSMGIVSATLGPVGAARGMVAAFPMRIALIKNLKPETYNMIAKAQAPITGISPEDFIKLRDWIERSGRAVVDRTVVEENNPYASLGKNSFLDYGQFFFNQGEVIARVGAATMNFLERRAKAPTEDIFDSAVSREMIRRQDILTASMTASSSAEWQRSLFAVPLQFATFQIRMMEQLFLSNKILTPREKVSLGLTQFIVYGAAGVPLAGAVMDRLGYTGDIPADNQLYDTLRYGAMDAILSGLTGEETALSTRIAAGEGLFDLLSGLGDKTLFEVAVGPGGAIAGESIYSVFNLAQNVIFSGNFDHVEYDWHRLARNVSSYNKAYNFAMAQRYGVMLSRKDDGVLLDNVGGMEGVLKLFGIPLEEEDVLWSTLGNMALDKKFLDMSAKEVRRLSNIADRAISEGRMDDAAPLINDIGAILELHRMAPGEEDYLMRELRNKTSLHQSIVKRLYEKGKVDIANKLAEMN